MDDACYCDDGERPSVYEPSDIAMARTVHRCTECRGVIFPGESYHRVFAVYPTIDGPEVMRMCAWCMEMKEWIEATVPCFCFMHHMFFEGVRDAVDHYAHETTGLQFGYWRRMYEIERRPRATEFLEIVNQPKEKT